MKNIFSLTLILFLSSAEILLAQYQGSRFLSGSAGINFTNNNPQSQTATNDYGYNFDISMGKFKTDKMAVGWRLSNFLGGAKSVYRIYDGNGQSQEFEKSGINSIGVGVGRFWQYYKHFNDKIGIFGGPQVDLSLSNSRSYETGSGSNINLIQTLTNKIQLSAGLSAGLYYHFTEKWWVTASLAFSNPISVDYSFMSRSVDGTGETFKQKQLNYSFSPNFTFPSVGFGLRYFYNR